MRPIFAKYPQCLKGFGAARQSKQTDKTGKQGKQNDQVSKNPPPPLSPPLPLAETRLKG